MSPSAIIAIFLMGIGNFAIQKAILDSGHPILALLPVPFRLPRTRVVLVLEFVVLLAALLIAANGYPGVALVYGIYTLANAMAAWLILRGDV